MEVCADRSDEQVLLDATRDLVPRLQKGIYQISQGINGSVERNRELCQQRDDVLRALERLSPPRNPYDY